MKIAWQTGIVGVLLMLQFALGQLAGGDASTLGFELPGLWKVVVIPTLLLGTGYALNQLKAVGAERYPAEPNPPKPPQ